MFGFFKKKKVEEPKKNAKEIATDNKEPYIAILSVEIDEKDPGNGAFELDWNEYFIAKLARSGYTGRDDEQMVDQWFQDVCRHVVLETYEQYEANDTLNIDKRDLGNGRSEFS
jgi:hypothetical protein